MTFCDNSVTDPAEGPGSPPPPYFKTKLTHEGLKKIFFGDRPHPPYLKVWMTMPHLYLKVWIRHCNGKINLNFQDRKRRNKGFESCYSLFSLVVVNIKDITRFPLSGDFKGTRV